MTVLINSQHVIETLVSNPAKLVDSQHVIETLVSNPANLVNTQLVMEVLMDPGSVNMDCTQIVLEIFGEIPNPSTDNGSSVLLFI